RPDEAFECASRAWALDPTETGSRANTACTYSLAAAAAGRAEDAVRVGEEVGRVGGTYLDQLRAHLGRALGFARRAMDIGARAGRLGTVDPTYGVHLVPITFALVGDTILTAVDHKPKISRRLRRIANIERNHDVTVLVDHYEEDWTRLWWCRLAGTARVVYQ